MGRQKKLYESHNYLNKNISSLKLPIKEYDMKEAGFSLIKEFDLLPSNQIIQLSQYTKQIRTIEIGKLIENDSKLGRNLMECFIKARKKFFENNNLNDIDILSIKKDAIFVIKKTCHNLKFGDNIEFVMKNRYTSYYYFNKCEFYYSSINKKLDIKGVSYKNHPLFEEIKNIFHCNEIIKNEDIVYKKLQLFRNNYLNYKLPLECYRLLSPNNNYRFKTKKGMKFFDINVDDIEEDKKEELDISYNYLHFIQPLIEIII